MMLYIESPYTMAPTDTAGERRVELYVRETLPKPAARQRERIVQRLTALEADGHVDSFEADDWDKRIRCVDPANDDARDRYLAFSRWASERGAALRPFFDTRECYSMETGDRADWIVFPALCLAVFDDDDLAAVFPHADGDTSRSVSDGLDLLERGREYLLEYLDDLDDGPGERDRLVVGSAD